MKIYYTLLINKNHLGFFVNIQTVNPATGKVLSIYTQLEQKDIFECIETSYKSYLVWRKTSFESRGKLMLNLAALLRKKKDEYAALIAREMGKPVAAGQAELEKCALVCEHYAVFTETYLSPRMIKTEHKKSMVCYQPLGVILGIMPWNFPFWQVFRFAVPTLMAGNTAILKHASISVGTGNAIAALFLQAGFPVGIFQHLIMDKNSVSDVISHEKIAAVTLTGSEQAGKTVAAQAGQHLKKVMLELGGSDPYLVLADADIQLAARCIVDSRLNNCGQVCIAAKRVLVVAEILEQLVDEIQLQMACYKIGDPLDMITNLGPMAREDLRTTLHQQVLDSIAKGARLCLGGMIPNTPGFYYPPTLLTHVSPGMPAFDEELFGPVISVIGVQDEAEAISLANQTHYGLGAAVFTRDIARGEHIAVHDIEAGVCFVNAIVASDPRMPFGGIKKSGFGRELSREGILEFVNVKTVVLNE